MGACHRRLLRIVPGRGHPVCLVRDGAALAEQEGRSPAAGAYRTGLKVQLFPKGLVGFSSLVAPPLASDGLGRHPTPGRGRQADLHPDDISLLLHLCVVFPD